MKLYLSNLFCPAVIAFVVLMSAAAAQAQIESPRHRAWNWKRHRTETIDFAKKYLVSGIEDGLPRQSFSRWFRSLVGKDARITWKIVDCGFEAGDGGERDHTMCVVADAAMGSDFAVTVYIEVGTFKDGLTWGKPAIRYARVSREDEPWQSTHSLTALPRTIDVMMSK